MSEDKRNEKKDKYSLSSANWIMFLSGEIHHAENISFMFPSIVIAAFAIILSMFTATDKISLLVLYSIAILFLALLWFIIYKMSNFIVKDLKKLRKKIISGNLTDSNEIRKEWGGIDETKISQRISNEVYKIVKKTVRWGTSLLTILMQVK